MSNRNSISSSLSSSFKSISRHDSQLSRKKDRDSYFDENDDEPIYFVDQPSAALICKCCEAVFRTGRGRLSQISHNLWLINDMSHLWY